MKKYTLNPEYSAYTVGQYIDYCKNSGSMLNQVCAITGMPKDEAIKLTPAQLKQVVTFFESVMESKESEFKCFWEHNGIKYGFIPNIESVTFGEWLDLNSAIQTHPTTMDKMLAILYRPVTMEFMGKYKIEDYSSDNHLSNRDIMRSMPLHIANGCMLFFSTIRSELWTTFQEYLEKQTNQNLEKAIKTTQQAIRESGMS